MYAFLIKAYRIKIEDMEHFWTHKDNIPGGLGYGQFKAGHFIWLSLTILFVVVYSVSYKNADLSLRVILLRSLSTVLILSDVIKMFILARADVRLSDYLPLEICSFGTYFIFLDSIWYDNSFFLQILLILFLPAATMAILFPTTSTLPFWNFYTIHQFFYHGAIIAYIVARFIANEIPLDYPSVLASIAKILVLVGIMYLIDSIFDKNFMFLRDPYGNPLLQLIWNKAKNGRFYTICLICFSIFIIHVFYLLFKVLSLLLLQ